MRGNVGGIFEGLIFIVKAQIFSFLDAIVSTKMLIILSNITIFFWFCFWISHYDMNDKYISMYSEKKNLITFGFQLYSAGLKRIF